LAYGIIFSTFPSFKFFVFFGVELTTKFNKEMYKKIKEKRNEPLSNIGQRRLRITEKEKKKEKETVERGSSTLALDLEEGQAVLLAFLLRRLLIL